MFIASPAKPLPQADAIGEMVRGITGICEAYLPHCFVMGVMEAPAQVLVLVIDRAANRERVLDSVGNGLALVVPPATQLEVFTIYEDDSLLASVRGTGTHLHCPPPLKKKPWWKILG